MGIFPLKCDLMWSYRSLSRIDFRVIPVILALMVISLLVISANTWNEMAHPSFFTPVVKQQIKWFVVGWIVYFLVAGFDYNKLREWTWPLYGLMLILLIGLFFTDPIQRVQRWYKIPGINISFQPSEYAKIALVIALSWFLERRSQDSRTIGTAFFSGIIVGIPFILILKQPDLGTALVLFPIALVMCYFGDIHPTVIKLMAWCGAAALLIVSVLFLEVVTHEQIRPYATKVLKEYQFDRLNPNTHHQKAAVTAIAIGGMSGKGWGKSEFTGGGWLPAPYTDSVYPAFGEEFGFLGLLVMMGLFYSLIYFSFQVSVVANSGFGRLLSAGIAVYLAIHIIVNVGMMSGMLPITGVPLLLVTYGGSSILSTMAALGLLQSVYSRRYMF